MSMGQVVISPSLTPTPSRIIPKPESVPDQLGIPRQNWDRFEWIPTDTDFIVMSIFVVIKLCIGTFSLNIYINNFFSQYIDII